MADEALLVFKVVLTVMPYDPRVYLLYFVCKDLYMLMPFDQWGKRSWERKRTKIYFWGNTDFLIDSKVSNWVLCLCWITSKFLCFWVFFLMEYSCVILLLFFFLLLKLINNSTRFRIWFFCFCLSEGKLVIECYLQVPIQLLRSIIISSCF